MKQQQKIVYFLQRLGLISLLATSSYADKLKIAPDIPVEILADRLTYDKELGLIVARGHVQIIQGNQQIKAQVVTYNQKLDLVTASGFVEITDQKGNTAYTPYLELAQGMKEGFIKEIKILTAEQDRFSAARGQRRDTLSVLERVLYTPCKPCQEKSKFPFTWYMKAEKIVLDEENQEFKFTNATLYMKKMPIFFTPYFSHPSPAVDRKQGILVPDYRLSGDLGAFVSIPYYIPFSPYNDLTIEPYFFTKELPLGSFLYRHRYKQGKLDFQGSFIKPDHIRALKMVQNNVKRGSSYLAFSDRPRWHSRFNGEYHLNQHWRLGAGINRVSDKFYYRHYPLFGYTQDSNLESKLIAEGFFGENYTTLKSYLFQNLDQNASLRDSPIILPLGQISLVSPKGYFNETWNLNVQGRSLYRQEGLNSQTLVVKGGIELPVVTKNGHSLHFNTTLQGNLYYTYLQKTRRQTTVVKAENKQTLFPKFSCGWQYPIAKYHQGTLMIIQPLVMAVGSPLIKQKNGIPNEDCRDFEYDDTALFIPDRFKGYDRLDKGSRIDYGIQGSIKTKGWSSLFIGQSYSLNHRKFFIEGSGLEYKNSDYVVRSIIVPQEWLTFNYRARFNRKGVRLRWNESGFTMGPPIFSFSTNYLFMDKQTTPNFKGKYHMISPGIEAKFAKFWTTNINMTRDLNRKHQLVQAAHLTYKDDCFEANIGLYRNFYQIPGVKRKPNIIARFDFKNLGSVAYGDYTNTLKKSAASPLKDAISVPLTNSSASSS